MRRCGYNTLGREISFRYLNVLDHRNCSKNCSRIAWKNFCTNKVTSKRGRIFQFLTQMKIFCHLVTLENSNNNLSNQYWKLHRTVVLVFYNKRKNIFSHTGLFFTLLSCKINYISNNLLKFTWIGLSWSFENRERFLESFLLDSQFFFLQKKSEKKNLRTSPRGVEELFSESFGSWRWTV